MPLSRLVRGDQAIIGRLLQAIQAMYSALEDISLLEEDWTDIQAMISSLDADNSFIHPKTHHMTDTALTAVKNDPDTPNLVEALLGDNEPQFREAMSNE
eukprot:741504-Ditylum_brightwellii.AAC.1